MKDIQTNEGDNSSATGPEDNQGRVTITIDGVEKRVRRGQHRVTELKELGSVPAEYALDQIIDGVLTELKDDDKVHIRGGEVFSSHPRTGGAA